MYNLELRITRLLQELDATAIVSTEKIQNIEIRQGRLDMPCRFSGIKDGFLPYSQGDEWSDTAFDSYALFRFNIDIKEAPAEQEYCLNITTNKYNGHNMQRPQMLLAFGDESFQGLDSNHTRAYLGDVLGKQEVNLYAFSGISKKGPYGSYVEMENFDGARLYAELELIDKRVKNLYFDISVPFMYLKLMDKSSADYIKILNTLNDALSLLDLRNPHSEQFYLGVARAEEYLEKNLYGIESYNAGKATMVGHTHIDIAWLWRYEHTRNKAQRSFATEVMLLDRYPEHRFMSSQALLYNFVKEDDPELYERIKELIKEGRWEAEGAMWVEPDINLSSGESIVRQIMYGKRFFKEEFGVDCEILWLPDVFGYTGALPQLIKKSDLKYFMTSKLPSNEINRFPYDTFIWRGIDGSEVLSHLTNYVCGYNAQIESGEIYTGWQKYKGKDINDDILINFGYADGGGGVTTEQVEVIKRSSRGIPGVPKTKISTPTEYFHSLEKRVSGNKRLPSWCGEIYYERHRGTYTSMARVKKQNRKCEFLLSNAEWLWMLSCCFEKRPFPKERFEVALKNLMINQFHDVLPGTSIEEVYKDTEVLYDEAFEIGEGICKEALSLIPRNDASGKITVFNPYSNRVSGYVKHKDKYLFVYDIPARGFATRDAEASKPQVAVSFDNNVVENEYYKITLNEKCEIVSLYDKRAEREAITPGKSANRLRIFEDLPGLPGGEREDNWNLDPYYKEREFELSAPEKWEIINEGGEYVIIRTECKYMSSTIKSDMIVYARSPRIDFNMDIDWKENCQVIKAEFPAFVNATRATYEIQYGYVERNTVFNTSYDEARYEVCGHKWADISDGGYGISILNDSKYGHSALGSELSLTLLRSGCCPNPSADKERHRFTYSLLPHIGDFREADVVKEAYLLNNPMFALDGDLAIENNSKEFPFLECDGAVIDTVKPAEYGDGIVLRIYEPYNRQNKVKIYCGKKIKSAEFMTLTEERVDDTTEITRIGDSELSFTIKPFEVLTLKLYI